jgi:hypothetical protein
MDSEVKIFGQVRGLNADILYGTGSEEVPFQLTGQGEQLVAQAAPKDVEIVRQGRSFWVNTAVAIASVIAMPTTAVGFALYNNEPDGGRCYSIDCVWALFVANPSILPQACIVACLGQVREAVPANALSATVTVKNRNGTEGKDTRVRVILSGTALPATTGFAGNWMPVISNTNASVTSLPGFQSMYDVNGRYIVPPGRYFAVHCVSAKIDVTCQFGIAWTEKLMNLG